MGSLTPEIRKRIVKAYKKGYRVKDIAAIFGVSRWVVWKWRKRAHHPGKDSYRSRSQRPLTIYSKVTQQIENAVIVLRDSFNWGTHRIALNLQYPPGYIHHLLTTITGCDWQPVALSRQTINNILKKHRRNGSPFERNKKDWKYFRSRKPNGLWQIDIKGPFLLDGKRLYALVIVDDHSRFIVYCGLYTAIRKEEVITSLGWAVKRYGYPKRLLCDNGSQFRSDDLKYWCKTHKVKYEPAPPHYPETKGKVERTIRNLKEEYLVLDKVFENVSLLLDEYVDWFNNVRYSLGVQGTPASFYLEC
ncbi:MAG: DDE-type integrase/transposase/recombinase [Candidatus Thermoplasmatota archaeon]